LSHPSSLPHPQAGQPTWFRLANASVRNIPDSPVLLLYYRHPLAVRKKRSISMPPELDAEIAHAAAQAGMSYSAWPADTVRREFTIRAGLAGVDQFERDHGAFTAAEIAAADEWAAQAI